MLPTTNLKNFTKLKSNNSLINLVTVCFGDRKKVFEIAHGFPISPFLFSIVD